MSSSPSAAAATAAAAAATMAAVVAGACVVTSLRRKQSATKQPSSLSAAAVQRVLVATRIHGKEAGVGKPLPNAAPLRAFLRRALAYADAVVVVVEVADVMAPTLLVRVRDVCRDFAGDGCPVHVLPVTPWGRFVPALNAALGLALDGGFSHLLFLSLEMDLPAAAFRRLAAHFDETHDLVVGTALEGHRFQPGVRPLDGCTSPWNTCALWSVPKLARTGFLAVSDGLPGDKGVAGIEEVAAIAVAQALRRGPPSISSLLLPGRGNDRAAGGMRAKLVSLKGHVGWNVVWDDPARQAWHAKKMESKVQRAEAQLAALGLGVRGRGVVWHVEDDEGGAAAAGEAMK